MFTNVERNISEATIIHGDAVGPRNRLGRVENRTTLVDCGSGSCTAAGVLAEVENGTAGNVHSVERATTVVVECAAIDCADCHYSVVSNRRGAYGLRERGNVGVT